MTVGRGLVLPMLLVGAASLSAGEPVLRNVNLRGLQVGGTTTIVCDGDEFGQAPRLLLPFPAQQLVKKGATAKQATFDVTLAADATPGYHHLRLVSADGVSQPVIIGVDRLPQRGLSAALDALPVALHGSVAGSALVETRFDGKAGQKVKIEVEAQRLGSKLRPVVHLQSPQRLQLAWAWPSPALHGDARLEATLPADGSYTITLHDLEYAAAAPAFFRMKVGQWSSIDQVFPPVVARGQAQAVELIGSDSFPAVKLPTLTSIAALPLSWPGDALWSGPRPFVSVSPHAELVEQPAAAKGQDLPAGPVGVSGRLLTPYEEDRYRLPVTPGTKVRLEVFAERIGSPLDASLVVRNEAGNELARAEDSPGTVDPILEYAVPDKVSTLVVAVADAQGRGSQRAIYRLSAEPASGAADFRLVTPLQALALPVGGRDVLPVQVERRGYSGPIELAASSLPPGTRLESANIPADADGALVTVQRGTEPAAPAITTWIGRGAAGDERPVSIKGHPLERLQPWLATEIAAAPTSTRADHFDLQWRGLPDGAALVPSKKLALPVKITRTGDDFDHSLTALSAWLRLPLRLRRPPDGAFVKLTLLTSQRTPLVNNQPDPNQALRAEKPVEMDAKLREGEVALIVPPLLAGPVYDVTVQAELLAADKKTVKAVAFAPVRRMAVRVPIVVRLDGPARIEATLDAKKETTLKLPGEVERLEGLDGDVALTLTGLPGGVRADAVTVKAGAQKFSLNVVLPATLAPGEIKGLKLGGTIAADPKQPTIRIRSRDVDVTLVVKAAQKE